MNQIVDQHKNICQKESGIFLSSTARQKNQNIVVTHPSTPLFLSPFFKNFVTHPPKINELDTAVTATFDPDNPQNLERVLVEPLIVNWSLSQQTQEIFTLTELCDGAKVLSVIGQEVQPSEYPKKQIIIKIIK